MKYNNKMYTQKFLEAKNDELHFLNQIIRVLKHLEYTYQVGVLANEKDLITIQNTLDTWNCKKSEVQQHIENINTSCKKI